MSSSMNDALVTRITETINTSVSSTLDGSTDQNFHPVWTHSCMKLNLMGS